MKLWIKTYVGDKITNSIVLSKKGVSRDVFDEMLKEAVDAFDLSTPVVLSQHFHHFANYNSVIFLPRDFVEPVDFDKLVVENVKED